MAPAFQQPISYELYHRCQGPSRGISKFGSGSYFSKDFQKGGKPVPSLRSAGHRSWLLGNVHAGRRGENCPNRRTKPHPPTRLACRFLKESAWAGAHPVRHLVVLFGVIARCLKSTPDPFARRFRDRDIRGQFSISHVTMTWRKQAWVLQGSWRRAPTGCAAAELGCVSVRDCLKAGRSSR